MGCKIKNNGQKTEILFDSDSQYSRGNTVITHVINANNLNPKSFTLNEEERTISIDTKVYKKFVSHIY